MKHEGQLVAGSGSAEGYSREVPGVDGGLGHVEDPTRGARDAAQALLGGLAVSSAITSNDHRHRHNGIAGTGDELQKDQGGAGGAGVQDAPNSPSSNRKGHDAEQTLLGGVGDLMKRARRGLDSYLSAAARQQKDVAREQRELRRKKSSNIDFPVDAEEVVGPLAIAGAEDGAGGGLENGMGTHGGPLHRPQSEVFVPSRSAAEQEDAPGPGIVSVTRSSGTAADPGEIRDVSEAPAFLQGVEEHMTGESTMERGRARLTTGDLRGRFRRASQLIDRKNSAEQWKRDWAQWADHGFKVLGVEIGHLPEHQQVALLAGGVFFFLSIYGYMQEYLLVKIFERQFMLFMTFLQFLGYAACAALRRGVHREQGRKIPLRTCFALGFMQAVIQGLTNVSMMYLNYPAKVLFKSSRMVPIMCFGMVWQGRRYSWRDCVIVSLVVVGLATYMSAEMRSAAVSETPTSRLGVVCISLALVFDAANINLQEEVINRYLSCQDELIMFSYLCGTVYVASFCVFFGELVSGIVFLHGKGLWAIGAVLVYCGAGFLGGSCAVALTKRYGALLSAITTTARKAVTLMLSFAFFQKAFTPQHLVGASVFMVGIMAKLFGKGSNSKGSARSYSGGYPVRSRSTPKMGGGADGSSTEEGGGGASRGGRWVRKEKLSPPRSPLPSRIASSPVTGLGFTTTAAEAAAEALAVSDLDDEARGRSTGESRRLPDDRGRHQQQKRHPGAVPDSRGQDHVSSMKRTGGTPELQEILPLMLTFLDSRGWCGCLRVSHAAHDAVRVLFLSFMPDGAGPEEGWTVPQDVLTLKTDEAGVAHLAANECGITISGELDNLTHLRAVIIPPPQSGFVSVEGERYIATSPILRCRWVGRDSSQGPWTVTFPLEEEDGLSNPTEISHVLRRGDDPRDEWEVQTAGLKACTRHPSMQVEVTHFSDVMTADKLREIEKTSPSSFYKRKRVWAKMFTRYVHVYNASSEPMTVLQVLPAVMESGRGVQLSVPLFGGGGGGSRELSIHDGNTIEVRQVAAWANAVDGSGSEPPSFPAKFETLLGTKEMRVVPYTATGSREENNLKVFPREFFHCSAGYDYYLLQKMINGSRRPRFWEGDVGVDMSEERRVMDIVNR